MQHYDCCGYISVITLSMHACDHSSIILSMVLFLLLLVLEENGTANGKAKSHANGSPVANGSMDVTPTSSESRQAFLELESVKPDERKLSVIEVFKKVAIQKPDRFTP